MIQNQNQKPVLSIGRRFFLRVATAVVTLSTLGSFVILFDAHSQIRVPSISNRIKRPRLVIPVPAPVPTPCFACDGDGDGISPEAGDCDDNDPGRYPGATEVCDAAGKDEDCDITTFGSRDEDGDGKISAACFQVGAPGYIGSDCDDSNPAIVTGAMACIPNQSGGYNAFDGTPLRNLSGSGSIYQCVGTAFKEVSCGPGLSCIAQPNGTGVCGVLPANIPTVPGERL
jgi:hypothetical protein